MSSSKLVLVTCFLAVFLALVNTAPADKVPPVAASSDKPDTPVGPDELPSTKPDAGKAALPDDSGDAAAGGKITLPSPVAENPEDPDPEDGDDDDDDSDDGATSDGAAPLQENTDKTDQDTDGAGPLEENTDTDTDTDDKTDTDTDTDTDSDGGDKTDQFQCKWMSGKGVGMKSVAQLKPPLSGQKCVDVCYAKKQTKKGKLIDAVVEFKDDSKSGCWCVHKSHDLSEKLTDFQTCYFNPEKAASIPGAAAPSPVLPESKGRPVEYTCDNELQPVFVGCYSYKDVSKGKYLYNERMDIDWTTKGHPVWAQGFVCACAQAAKANGVSMFATHYWGDRKSVV